MKRTLKRMLLASALGASAVSLSGCIGLTVAGIAANVVTSMVGGGGSGAPAEAPSPSQQIAEGLSTIDDKISPSCTAKLAQARADLAAGRSLATDRGETAPNPWGDPRWTFGDSAADGQTEGMTAAAARSQRAQACGIRLTCLPGMSQPTRMMVCGEDADDAAAVPAAAPAGDPAGAEGGAGAGAEPERQEAAAQNRIR